MKFYKSLLVFGLIGALLVFLTERVRAQNGTVSAQQSVSDKRDGQHDFDVHRLAKQTNVALCPTPHNSLSKALQELHQ